METREMEEALATTAMGGQRGMSSSGWEVRGDRGGVGRVGVGAGRGAWEDLEDEMGEALKFGGIGRSTESDMNHVVFVEDGSSGDFRTMELDTFATALKQKRMEEAMVAAGDRSGDDSGAEGSQSGLKVASDTIAETLASCFLFAQGLIGGWCLMLVFLLYVVCEGDQTLILRYYSPMAMASSRTWLVLSSVSLVACFDKLAKDMLYVPLSSDGAPVGGRRGVNVVLIVAHALLFFLSIASIPFDERIYYAWLRVPDWAEGTISSYYTTNLTWWEVLQAVKVAIGLLCWAATCIDAQTYRAVVTKDHLAREHRGVEVVNRGAESQAPMRTNLEARPGGAPTSGDGLRRRP